MSEQQQIAEQKQVAFSEAESAKLATIQEEQPEKKSASSIIKAVIAKAKGLLGCINFQNREKPAKTEEKKEEQMEEKVVEEPKVESVAPTLPAMSAPAPVAPVTPAAPVAAPAAPPADI